MRKRTDRHNSLGIRFMALAVAVIFTVTSVSWNAPAIAAPAETGVPLPRASTLAGIVIPSEMGTVVRVSLPQTPDLRPQTLDSAEQNTTKSERLRSSVSGLQPRTGDSRFVVLIQDAHAVIDAQENISKILGHLRKDYGVDLVALEGAKGRLEPILLRSFPDEVAKRKVLAGYEKRAELSGPEMASVLQADGGEYRGMEDWALYEKNYGAYLRAQMKKESLSVAWNSAKQALDRERPGVFTPELSEFQDNWESFRCDRSSLLDLLLYLSEFKRLLKVPVKAIALSVPPVAGGEVKREPYPELSRLIESIGYEKSGRSEALAPLVRTIADEFKSKHLRGLGVKTELNFYNRYQAFLTGQITPGQMLQFLVQTGAEHGKRLKLSPDLKKLLGHAELLSEIKGTRIYDELERFLAEAEASLLKTPEQAALAEKYRRLFLIKDMIALELSHEDFARYQKDPESYLSLATDPAFRQDLAPAQKFYEAALERDHAFCEHIESMLKEQSRDPRPAVLAVVAGGFHTAGLEALLRERDIDYAVVTPRIGSLAGSGNYAKVIKGDVSFKADIRTTYFDGLMRHAAKALTSAISLPDRVETLRRWRGNLIRELARQNRITDASKYLPYIDEQLAALGAVAPQGPKRSKDEIVGIVRRELEKYKKESFDRVWKTFEFQLEIFTGGLKELIANKDLNTQSVTTLLDRASQTKPVVLQACAAMGLFPDIKPPQLSELSADEDVPSPVFKKGTSESGADSAAAPNFVAGDGIARSAVAPPGSEDGSLAGHLPNRVGEVTAKKSGPVALLTEAGPGLRTRRSEIKRPVEGLKDPALRKLIEMMLSRRYSGSGLDQTHPNLAGSILDSLADTDGDRDALYRDVINYKTDDVWKSAYDEYSGRKKYSDTYEQIEPFLAGLPEGSVILDVGAGGNDLGYQIAVAHPELTVRGTDPYFDAEKYKDPFKKKLDNLSFIPQTDKHGRATPFRLPIKSGTVAVITMNAALHHVAPKDLPRFMREIKRVLKPDGRLILIEDTYSLKIDPETKGTDPVLTNAFLEQVRSLKENGADFARRFLMFNDWYGNIVVHGWDGMSMPHNFHSMEEWQEVLAPLGLTPAVSEDGTIAFRHIGFPDGGFHKPGIGVMAFTFDRSEARREGPQISGSWFSVLHPQHMLLTGLVAGLGWLTDLGGVAFRGWTRLPGNHDYYFRALGWIPDFGMPLFVMNAAMILHFRVFRPDLRFSKNEWVEMRNVVIPAGSLMFVAAEFIFPLLLPSSQTGGTFSWGDVFAIISAGVTSFVAHQARVASVTTSSGPVKSRSEARTKTLETPEELVNVVGKYEASYLFIGHGANNQFRKEDLGILRLKIAGIVQAQDAKWGKGKWLAIYGGDRADEVNPDIGYAMAILKTYGVPILAVRSNSDTVSPSDEIADFIYSYTSKRSPNDKPIRGGIWWGNPEGGTSYYLTEELKQKGLKGVYSFGGGQTAMEEYQYAQKLGLETMHFPFRVGKPGQAGAFGALDRRLLEKDFGISAAQRNVWEAFYLSDPQASNFTFLSHGVPGMTGDQYRNLDPSEWAVFGFRYDNSFKPGSAEYAENVRRKEQIRGSLRNNITTDFESDFHLLFSENAMEKRQPRESPVYIFWAVSKTNPGRVVVGFVNQSERTTALESAEEGNGLATVIASKGESPTFQRIFENGDVWDSGQGMPWGVVAVRGYHRTGFFGVREMWFNRFFESRQVLRLVSLGLAVLYAAMATTQYYIAKLESAYPLSDSLWKILSLSAYPASSKILLAIPLFYFSIKGYRYLKNQFLKRGTEIYVKPSQDSEMTKRSESRDAEKRIAQTVEELRRLDLSDDPDSQRALEAVRRDRFLKIVYFVRLQETDAEVGELDVFGPQGSSIDPALRDAMDRFTGFSTANFDEALALKNSGRSIFAALTDWDPSTEGYMANANGRQAYVILEDGRWLGIKGSGAFSPGVVLGALHEGGPLLDGFVIGLEKRNSKIVAETFLEGFQKGHIRPLGARQLLKIPHQNRVMGINEALPEDGLDVHLVFNLVDYPQRMATVVSKMEENGNSEYLESVLPAIKAGLRASGLISEEQERNWVLRDWVLFAAERWGNGYSLALENGFMWVTFHNQDLTPACIADMEELGTKGDWKILHKRDAGTDGDRLMSWEIRKNVGMFFQTLKTLLGSEDAWEAKKAWVRGYLREVPAEKIRSIWLGTESDLTTVNPGLITHRRKGATGPDAEKELRTLAEDELKRREASPAVESDTGISGGRSEARHKIFMPARNTRIVEVREDINYGHILKSLRAVIRFGRGVVLTYPSHVKMARELGVGFQSAREVDSVIPSDEGELPASELTEWGKTTSPSEMLHILITGNFLEFCVAGAVKSIVEWQIQNGRQASYHFLGDKIQMAPGKGPSVFAGELFASLNENNFDQQLFYAWLMSIGMRPDQVGLYQDGKRLGPEGDVGQNRISLYFWTDTGEFLKNVTQKPTPSVSRTAEADLTVRRSESRRSGSPSVAAQLSDMKNSLIKGWSGALKPGLMIDPKTGYPLDYIKDEERADFTQPTSIGFLTEYLASKIAGDLSPGEATPEAAVTADLGQLNALLSRLRSDQSKFGWLAPGTPPYDEQGNSNRTGLLPWLKLVQGASEPLTEEIAYIDNANLAVSLMDAAGALIRARPNHPALTSELEAAINAIKGILDKMGNGFTAFYDPDRGLFHFSWRPSGFTLGHIDRLFSEHGGKTAVIVTYFGIAESAMTNLKAVFTPYVFRDGKRRFVATPWDGGGFQMAWILHLVSSVPVFKVAMRNFLKAMMDKSSREGIPGLPSAAIDPVTLQYNGRVGTQDLAETSYRVTWSIGTFYALLGFLPLASEIILLWVRSILEQIPELNGPYGPYDSADAAGNVGKAYLAIDLLSSLLGLIGTQAESFQVFLESVGKWEPFKDLLNKTKFPAGAVINAHIRFAPVPVIKIAPGGVVKMAEVMTVTVGAIDSGKAAPAVSARVTEKAFEPGLLSAINPDPELIAESAAVQGPEVIRAELRRKGEATLRAQEMEFDMGEAKFLEDLFRDSEPIAVLLSPAGETMLRERFPGVEFMDLNVADLYKRLVEAASAPAVTGAEEGYLDAGKDLDDKRMSQVLGSIRGAIAGDHAPRVVLLVNRPDGNTEAEAFLDMIKDLPIEQLIVFYRKGQLLGASWLKAAQGRLTPMIVKSPEDRTQKAARAAAAQDPGAATVALSSGEDLGVGKSGVILSLLLEIGRLKNADLKAISLGSVDVMIRIYAAASQSEREQMLIKPELLLTQLRERTGLDLKLLRGEGGAFSVDLGALVESFVSQQAVEKAA